MGYFDVEFTDPKSFEFNKNETYLGRMLSSSAKGMLYEEAPKCMVVLFTKNGSIPHV